MNNKITSIAAALVAKAGTNASAGIGANNKHHSKMSNQKEDTTTDGHNFTRKFLQAVLPRQRTHL